MNEKLKLVYFSPTDSTKAILHKICEEMSLPIDEEFNLTNHEHQNFEYTFDENDVILLGSPVYGARIPRPAKNRFIGLRGQKSKIVPILIYGDVHYDNALVELYEIIKDNGFNIIEIAVFVYRHNLFKYVGLDRPNNKDKELIKYFGKRIVDKINENNDESIKM